MHRWQYRIAMRMIEICQGHMRGKILKLKNVKERFEVFTVVITSSFIFSGEMPCSILQV
jgi:hypothetical protein